MEVSIMEMTLLGGGITSSNDARIPTPFISTENMCKHEN